ncbi:DUF3027 domain-containing protein [Kocuria sp.]|uniref:DUF3027 domain-containing protein n=1 Tax=Kocuria sp. TaxID=1871328 RepID=UPI0028117022|nr:DUF3027 domain-containing protein [Kocuria sp.]
MTQEIATDAPAGDAEPASAAQPPARPARRRRAPKPDPLLVDSVAAARTAVEEIAEPGQIGEGHHVRIEEDRLVTHLFECALPGYRGWNWFASLARAPRSRTVTVCEVGLLPGDDALLAPEWVPWAERVSPEEKALEDAAELEEAAERELAEQDDAEAEAAAGDPVAEHPGAEGAGRDTGRPQGGDPS